MPRQTPSLNLSLPRGEDIIKSILVSPSELDKGLHSLLTVNPLVFKSFRWFPDRRPSLASHLFDDIYEFIAPSFSLEIRRDGDPFRPPAYYHAALLYSTLLARAFVKTREMFDEYPSPDNVPKALHIQSRQLWWVISYTIILALFSGEDPEPGVRYCAAVVMLCASKAIEKAGVKGKRKGPCPWVEALNQPEAEWDFQEVKAAFLDTKHLPQSNTDRNERRKRYMSSEGTRRFEFILQEELDALSKARDKLEHPEREDLTSKEVIEMFAPQLEASREGLVLKY